jgi:hypothetical protein
MSKIKIKKDVFFLNKDTPITWKEIKDFKYEDDDIININLQESYYSDETNSWDMFFYCCVERMVEETDEEYEDRMERKRATDVLLKKNRYEQYLKLKKEFEIE